MADTMPNNLPYTRPPAKRFSTPALLFGSIIAGLGVAGIMSAIDGVDSDAGLAIGMILGGITTVAGLLYRYRVTTPSVVPSPIEASRAVSSDVER